MKIRSRLTLQFTGIFSVILLLLLFSIYFLTQQMIRQEFSERLRSRALLRASLHLENQEIDQELFDGFVKKYISVLKDEKFEIYILKKNKSFEEKNKKLKVDNEILRKIIKEKDYYFVINHREYIGLFYDNRGESFLIIVSAVNDFGEKQLSKTGDLLIITFFVLLIIISILGIIFSKRALLPITILTIKANEISASNLHERLLEVESKDEIAELAITINKLLSRLEDSFELQKSFVSNASHELRTPLTSIIGNLEVILSREDRSKQDYEKVLQDSLQSSRQMKDLLNELLMFAQSSIYKESNFQEDIRLDEMLFDASDDLKLKYPDADIQIDFINLPDDAEKLNIKGNKHLLLIVFLNLIDNAIKYSDNKPIKCSLEYTLRGIEIKFIDKGIGIDKNEVSKIFQPFYRAENAREKQGQGIGLALIDKILQAHKAKIKVQSELEIGSTFTVYFPNIVKK
ncbi:MAG: HAMP domain-containing sensor histidine kinase [Candidatus Kapabacteria bacterium]|nr:HAMP domain-containing sensor histidine kinase [Candidatus Kapabacteria bacterium]